MDLTVGLMCEQRIAEIHQKQIEHGVCFDIRRAQWYTHSLGEQLLRLYLDIKKYLSYDVMSPNANKATKPFTKSGEYTSHTKAWYGEYNIYDVGGEFCKVLFESPDHILTKREKLGKQLIKLGWIPREKTATGIPILVKGGEPCPNLKDFGVLGKNLSMYYILSHRRNQIIGFTKHIWYDDKGICRISSHAKTIGTPTFRYTHQVVANIPKAADYVVFGKQMRSLFSAPKGYKMVGSDAAGLELRMLAHYIDDTEYTNVILNGDIHSHHQSMAQLPTRDNAKSFIYAFLYGAGNAKLGSVVNGSVKKGKELKEKFLKANPNLSRLITSVQKQASTGCLTGVDGRRLIMRKDSRSGEPMVHKALNTLLQAAGAVVMKYSNIILQDWVSVLELDAKQVISYHDELQWEVHEEDVELFQILTNHWVKYAGELLKLNCPLASDSQVGNNWSETH